MADYIERDKAVEKINAYCELRQAICSNDKDEFLRGLQTALKAISYNDVIPAADVRPVLHGKWVDEFYSDLLECFIATCSVCGCDNDSRLRISETHRFCKYCGAIMDLKDGDTNG